MTGVLKQKFTAVAPVGNSDARIIQNNSRLSFHGIEVQPEHLPILEKVWKKYGNVFEGSVLQSLEAKSMALRCLAKIIITLQTPAESLTNDQIAYLKSTSADLQYMRLKINWLAHTVAILLSLHKNLQDQLATVEEAKMQAERAEKRLIKRVAELRQEFDI